MRVMCLNFGRKKDYMKLSVIVTTYNAPEWLEKVLIGYGHQSTYDFEIIIADDGSDDRTKQLIDKYKVRMSVPLLHIWQPDTGFNKCEILNKAIIASNTEYLLFTDGDCIPGYTFVEVHLSKRIKGYFLSGGYFKLPLSISQKITGDDIISQRCFNIKWLKSQGLRNSFKNTKLFFKGVAARIMNSVTPTKASWNGHNSSGWKEDIIAVNGYDERMRYGALDRELGERLVNKGIRGKQIRYSAICVHLDHSRGYKNNKDIDFNKDIRKQTRDQKKTFTEFGIKKF